MVFYVQKFEKRPFYEVNFFSWNRSYWVPKNRKFYVDLKNVHLRDKMLPKNVKIKKREIGTWPNLDLQSSF